MSEDHDQEASDPACQIVELLPTLERVVRRLRIGQWDRPWRHQQMEDHVQSILLLLIEDDYRRLRWRHPGSSLEAWLKTIANHHLADCLGGWIPTGDCSEDLSGALMVEARQEDEMIYQERLERLREVFGQLSVQERLLGQSLLSDLETEEIAVALGIEPSQVRKRRSKLIKKTRARLAVGLRERKAKINSKRQGTFSEKSRLYE
jgi:RNA polymerase sigma factor (sigma-70 family)